MRDLRCGVWISVLFATVASWYVTTAHAEPAEIQRNITFPGYSPLATTTQLFSRMMSPLWEAMAIAAYADKGQQPPNYTVDMEQERFSLYVPSTPAPEKGYGLLVFIPPWSNAAVPRKWKSLLEETGTVFVTAANSGNDQSQIPRRMALALHGYANVVARYKIDPERVYVGGFSGGSRVALRVAIGYPDVFRGAILDAGSDSIGSFLLPLPAPDLLNLAQEHTRLIFLYGSVDDENAKRARYTMESARDWCFPETAKIAMIDRAHELADPVTMLRALRLQEPAHQPIADLEQCRARVDAEAATAVEAVQKQISSGAQGATKALAELDARYAHFLAADVMRLSGELKSRERKSGEPRQQ